MKFSTREDVSAAVQFILRALRAPLSRTRFDIGVGRRPVSEINYSVVANRTRLKSRAAFPLPAAAPVPFIDRPAGAEALRLLFFSGNSMRERTKPVPVP